ncbi:hypothetical protein DFJ77DRAFT_36632 [Powellomyces hirtus]|nr:hypothetical protein DFJ77DRAFT_36632 [Powellomyces hirtus]
MHLDDTSSASLKDLLTSQLTPICDADPTVLADYVIALLKHEKSIPDLKVLCISQLDDFLKEETKPFVATLFDSLVSQGYLESDEKPADHSGIPIQSATTARSESKRTYEEEISDDEDGDRNFKHTRRGLLEGAADKASPGVDMAADRRLPRDRTRSDDLSARKRGRPEENQYAAQPEAYANNKFPRHEVTGSATSEHKRRRSEEKPSEGSEMHRNRDYNGPGPTQFPPGPGRRDFDRNARDGRPGGQPRFPHMMPNQPMGMGPGRWDGGPEWGNPHMGLPLPDRDGRFMDRDAGAFRGRMQDRQPGRGGPMRGGFSNGRGRRPCRDYEERGYCLRGDACPYDHGLDRIVVDDLPMVGGRPPFDMMGPGPMGSVMRPPPFNGPFGTNGRPPYDMDHFGMHGLGPPAEAYDPERASFSVAGRAGKDVSDASQGDGPAPDRPASDLASKTGAFPSGDTSRGGFRGRGFPRRGGSRGGMNDAHGGFGGHHGGFNAQNNAFNGQPHFPGQQGGFGGHQGGFNRQQGGYHGQQQRTNDTLVVQNVPTEHLAIDKISDFFKKFGTITNIKLNVPASRAIVQFAQPQQAMAAYRSPDPIFDNRFVKVFWASQENPGADSGAADVPPAPAAAASRRSFVVSEPAPAAPVVPEDAAAAKAAAEEKKEKAKQMLEMQQSLIGKQLEEQKKIMEKLKSTTLNPKEKKALLDQFEILSKSLKTVMQSASSHVSAAHTQVKPAPLSREDRERQRLDRELDALNQSQQAPAAAGPDSNLVAHLEALKAQAAERGIDPAAVLAAGESRGGGHAFGRGRGRGAWAAGGRGGSRMTLDNRTTKIQIKGIVPPAHLQLKSYFEAFGTVSGLTFSDNDTNAIVEFASRRDAERAMSEPVKLEGAEAVDMSWLTASSSSPDAAAALSSSTVSAYPATAPAGHQNGKGGGELTAATGADATKRAWEEEDEDEDDTETSWKRR